MPKKAIAARVLPILAVGAVLALSLVGVGRVHIDGKLVACVGYGTGYGYVGTPSVTAVNPAAGPIAGGTTVTITGQGFCDFPASVHFGATAATSFTVDSDTSITAVSPAHVAGQVDVTVTTVGGTSATSAADHFTFTAFNYYFQWFDKASTGFLNDNIHLLNTSASPANIFVNMPGATTINVTLASGAATYVSFPAGSIGGPVRVDSDQGILASQRVQFNGSFNEVWAESATQAAMVSYLNWFDKASDGFLNDNIHITNPGTTPSTVTVTVTGLSTGAVIQPGTSTYVTFPQGTIAGPVTITVTSGPAVLASQRVQFRQTFNEVWAVSAAQASTTAYVNWYDKASAGFLNDNVHLLNPGVATSNVTVSVGAATVTVNVGAGLETYVHFPQGTIGGPITIVVNSGPAVLSSQRVQFNDSFNEVSSETAAQATAVSHLNWYDKASTGFLSDNIHLLNPGASTAFVTVSLGSASVATTVAAGAETYVSLPQGTIGGPVTITVNAGPAVLAAARVQFQMTFNEIWSM